MKDTTKFNDIELKYLDQFNSKKLSRPVQLNLFNEATANDLFKERDEFENKKEVWDNELTGYKYVNKDEILTKAFVS